LHTGQYAGNVSSDPSQGQALVEPLALPGANRHINKFLLRGHSERGGGLAIHTSGQNCNWLQVVIALEARYFRHFAAMEPYLTSNLPQRHFVLLFQHICESAKMFFFLDIPLLNGTLKQVLNPSREARLQNKLILLWLLPDQINLQSEARAMIASFVVCIRMIA